MRRLYSIALLGANFLGHWLRKLWPFRPSGLSLVQEYYGPDRVGLFTAEDLARFPDYSKCTACNLCRAAMPAGYAGVMPDALPLALTRTPTIAWTVEKELAAHPDWSAAEALCPVAVPLGEAAKLILAQARRTAPAGGRRVTP